MAQPTDVETTGRYLVLLEEDSVAAGMNAINRVAGIRTVSTADAAGASASDQFGAANGLMLHELGVAVVDAGPEQVSRLNRAAAEPGPISVVEPERVVHAIAVETSAPEAAAVDESTFTWGVQAVSANLSNATGAGIRVAVLDTGVDKTHPDLAGRTLVTSSFVNGEDVQDGHGHGTHCIGTSCGPRTPQTLPGYGIAHQAEIYAGKVLGNRGSGDDGGILAGISWAITNGCAVVSMSLGADVAPGTAYSQVYEQAAQRAMSRGTLIIAAAGNASDRHNGRIAPVGHPANCPSVMAVAAIDVRGGIAPFSSGTVDTIGQVDLAAPGVDVHSSWPMPTRYRRISGTSMATPHVSGVAALIAQQTGARGWELWARLVQSAHRLPLPSTDVGAGLVQAP